MALPDFVLLERLYSSGIDGLVVIARADPPDPIPNSAVKSLSAHGTASQDVGE